MNLWRTFTEETITFQTILRNIGQSTKSTMVPLDLIVLIYFLQVPTLYGV